tara:strand:+ start:4453 stop:5274 length:822 start_codon:yes stop_codon:yes gene_type:complete
MVNQAEQQDNSQGTQAPLPETGNTTTDITSDFEGVDTFQDFGNTDTPAENTEQPVDTDSTEPVAEQPDTPAEQPVNTDAPPAAPENTPPPSLEPQDNIKQRLEAVEQQNAQYQQQQQERQIVEQYNKYKADLENAGYLPDQAEHVANNWYQSVSQQAQAQAQQRQYAEFIQGQQAAAEHFANQYKLELSDLNELRQYQTPDSMEAAAKRIASDREKDAEIARLRAQLVPSQSFNDNESTPAANNSEDRWLERYNQGDRSPEAQSAARRAAGLG